MSLYIKLFTNFWTHRKTAKLRSLLGNDAYWIPPRLWSYAAENQPDGDFSSYNEIELAMLIGYNGDATSMLQALQQACFMDGMKIHDWDEHNEYHHVFSERAKNAATKRWEKKGEDKIREDKIRDKHSLKHATSINEPKTEDGFSNFWEIYPGASEKAVCQKLWRDLKMDKEKTEMVLRVLREHVKSKKWKEGFIISSKKWIEGHCWEDKIKTNGSTKLNLISEEEMSKI